jgi:hypothetical protein
LDDADQHEVYTRLGERRKPLLDETHRELTRKEFEMETPLFLTPREE